MYSFLSPLFQFQLYSTTTKKQRKYSIFHILSSSSSKIKSMKSIKVVGILFFICFALDFCQFDFLTSTLMYIKNNELYNQHLLSKRRDYHGNTIFVSASVTMHQQGQDYRPDIFSNEAILRVNLPDQHYNVSLFQCKHGVFLLNPQDSFISRSLINYGEWEEKEVQMLLHAFVSEGDIILDVGANIGSFTVPMAKAVGRHGMIYAWEPLRENYHKLVANIALNGLTNVKTYWSATSFIPSSTCKVNQVQEVNDNPEFSPKDKDP